MLRDPFTIVTKRVATVEGQKIDHVTRIEPAIPLNDTNDSDSPIRNLLKVQTVRCVSVDKKFGTGEGRLEALPPL